MKLAEDVLIQIIEAVRKGLSEGVDISELLRNIDVEVDAANGRVKLSNQNWPVNPPQFGMGALPPKKD